MLGHRPGRKEENKAWACRLAGGRRQEGALKVFWGCRNAEERLWLEMSRRASRRRVLLSSSTLKGRGGRTWQEVCEEERTFPLEWKEL